jgi:hypothetical protein
MQDLREYGFGDWFSVFLRALPAYLLALVVVALVLVVPVGAVGALYWFFLQR